MKRSFVLVALVGLSACAITSREATTELPGTSWTLVDLDGAESVGETPPGITFTDDGGVTGTTGCNTFNGEVTIDGSELTFGPLATTRMACADPALADQEQAFLVAIETVEGYTIDEEGRLVLDGDMPLTFEAAAEAG
jgi:heat shock protein HslJ